MAASPTWKRLPSSLLKSSEEKSTSLTKRQMTVYAGDTVACHIGGVQRGNGPARARTRTQAEPRERAARPSDIETTIDGLNKNGTEIVRIAYFNVGDRCLFTGQGRIHALAPITERGRVRNQPIK
jgi:hypothetical protein